MSHKEFKTRNQSLPLWRRWIKNIRGLTLMELIIASILMGLIMMGVVSLDYAMRRTHAVSAMSGDISMRIAGAMVHIFNQASQAVGMSSDLGIVIYNNPPIHALFLRIDRNNTPGDFSDDPWVRYIHRASPPNDRDVYFCDTIPDLGVPQAYDPNFCSGTQYLLAHVKSIAYNLTNDPPNLEFYLQVDIEGWADDTGPDPDLFPTKNKKYITSTRISPVGHTY